MSLDACDEIERLEKLLTKYFLLWDIAVEYEGSDWAYDVTEEATRRSDE